MSEYSSSPVQTFTIGFQGGKKTNEVDGARAFAAMFGAEHHFMIVSPDDYLKYYERYLWDLEEPVGNETAAAFYFVSKIARERVKVALTGQGADEPWAGYDRYLGVKISNVYNRLPHLITNSLAFFTNRIPGRFERLKRAAVSLGERDLLMRFTKIYSFFNSDMKKELFKGVLKEKFKNDGYMAKEALRRLYKDVKFLDPLTQMLYIDTRASLPDDLLMVADKTSMANSLEVRVPFLDFRLIEFIESIPARLKLKGFTGKYLHKKAVEKWLPKNIVYGKKRGFANPVEEWLRSKMRSFVEEYLLNHNSASSIYFDQKYIRRMLDRDLNGKDQLRRHIYLLISFEMWHRKFVRCPNE